MGGGMQRARGALAVWAGLVVVALLAAVALGQDATATPTVVVAAPDREQALYVALITGATPMLIALVKYLAPRIPSVWLPIAGPIVGALISIVGYYGTSAEVSVIVAAFAGIAGVGLREAYDQIKQRLKPAS